MGARAYLELLRPLTLVPPLVVGVALGVASGMSLQSSALAGASLSLAQGCGQVVNQVVDRELDRVVKPRRPIPRGLVTVEEAMGISWLLALLSASTALLVSVRFAAMVLAMLFFAVFYSLPPLSPRRVNPWLNHLWVSFSRSVLPFLAVMGVGGWRYAALALAWAFGWQATKDVPDTEGDRRFGIKTVADTYGVEAVKLLAAAGTVTYAALAVVWGLWVFLLNLPLAVCGLLGFERRWRGENTVAWLAYYAGLGVVAVCTLVESYI